MTAPKQEIVSFKVDQALLGMLKRIPNRSEFIRNAILAALNSSCPLCGGLGILTPKQKEHWQRFADRHAVVECEECHELHIVCSNGENGQDSCKGEGERIESDG